MLAGMLLHVIETPGAVHLAFGAIPLHFPLHHMEDAALLLDDIEDRDSVDRSPIRRLSPPFRIETGLIQNQGGMPFVDFPSRDSGLKFPQIGVFEIEAAAGGDGLLAHVNILDIPA